MFEVWGNYMSYYTRLPECKRHSGFLEGHCIHCMQERNSAKKIPGTDSIEIRAGCYGNLVQQGIMTPLEATQNLYSVSPSPGITTGTLENKEDDTHLFKNIEVESKKLNMWVK